MKLVDRAIRKPVTVTVGVVFTVLFGGIALFQIPVQLIPDVRKTEITVETRWRGASPQEMEREIIQAQEDQLKNVEGLSQIKSESFDGFGSIILEFRTGTSTESALLDVSNKLSQVAEYPPDADEPVITASGEENDASAWFVLRKQQGDPQEVELERTFLEDNVKPLLERVTGVSKSNLYGGRDREMHILVDTQALAGRRITLQEVFQALRRENQNISAGDLEESKRRYVVRMVGRFTRPGDVENVIPKETDAGPIRLGDVAQVQLGYREREVMVRNRGVPALAMNAIRAVGANVLEVMKRLKVLVTEINRDILAVRGLIMEQVYDETEYIYSALALVRQNLWVGGGLAVLILFVFLRSFTSTLIIATSIPISVVGAFVVMALMGRTVNVISLAGLAFAVGMVLDNAIVVLENIFRHRQMGEDRDVAASQGAAEVWGALLASTLTTLAVFLPVIFVQEEVGQLFRDIAVAVSCAVGLSLVVSITVIPTMASRALRLTYGTRLAYGTSQGNGRRHRVVLLVHWIDELGHLFARGFCGIFLWVSKGVVRRVFLILVITGLAIGLTWQLMPKTEYLPEGNRNLLFGFLIPPPGYNVDEVTRMGQAIESDLAPYWKASGEERPDDGLPGIRNFFYVALGRAAFMGTVSEDPERVRALLPKVQGALRTIPGLIAVVQQSSLFGRLSEGRSIDVEILGPDLTRLLALGRTIFGRILQGMPGAQVRPIPSLDLGEPEIQVIPDRDRAARLGLTSEEIGSKVAAVVDGVVVSDIWYQGDKIDLVLMGQKEHVQGIENLESMEFLTPTGSRVTLGDVAQIRLLSGPKQINHIERQRAIVVRVIPSQEMPLQEAIDWVNNQVVAPLRAQGAVEPPYAIRLAGTADKLTQTWSVLRWDFLLALVISFLLMSSLFESFFYPLVILFSVPLAAVGGFLGLFLVNRFIAYQPLDVVTMLGFIILIGIVVNNAILLVHQALMDMREGGLAAREAINGAIFKRQRPIFMTTATSVFGMLPLVLFPGAGAELYRGLGSVVVGGLALSTLFTLILVPTVLSLVLEVREKVGQSLSVGSNAPRGSNNQA